MAAPPLFKVVRLDRRFTGRVFFEYCIDYRFGQNKISAFLEHRAWFWESFGASGEYALWAKVHQDSPKISARWAWDTAYDQRRIYVRDQETLSAFLLTFG